MATKFAKLFETEDVGQILVVLDRNDDDEPCVRFSIQPEGLGVCSMAPGFSDDDEGWDRAEALFAKVDEAFAHARAQDLLSTLAATGF